MVAHAVMTEKVKKGNGIIDSLMKPFTYERFNGERHGISLAPATFGQPFSFMGPGTRLDMRLDANYVPKPDSQPINRADMVSYQHDVAYDRAKKNYLKNPTPENRKAQLNKVWEADDKFINEMNNDTEEPMAPIAGKLISTKKSLEQMGVLPSTVFEGFGNESKDPTERLKILAKQINKKEKRKRKNKKVIKGGFAPALIPIGVAVASTLSSKIVSDLYDYLKKKIKGEGINVPNHKSKNEKKLFLIEIIKSI